MRSELTLGIVGVGNLGGALSEGALAAGAVGRIVAQDVSKPRLEELAQRLGDRFTVDGPGNRAADADMLVLAVKPHLISTVIAELGYSLRPGGVLVSVAAGVPIGNIESGLPDGYPVVRAMPNLAMVVGESATALCANPSVTDRHWESVEAVFRSVGTTVRVAESQMHAVTGLSGSGPAYVALLLDGLASGGVKCGLPPDTARALACQLLYGTAKLLRDKDLHPSVLRDQVTTPAGTTIAGLHELEANAVRGALMSAVEAAADRSAELGSEDRG